MQYPTINNQLSTKNFPKYLPSNEGVPITSPDVLENPRYGRWRRDDQHAYGSRMEMENSRDWRPNEVGRFGTMNINYSRPHTLTQDVEIRAPRAVRVVRTLRILHFCAAYRLAAFLNLNSFKFNEGKFATGS